MAAETIIESFCERCGTRYTFEPVRKRESKLVGLGKSLGILLDDQGSSHASRDPFHGTFHFCLECRQYTCPTCWNEKAGFCLGCVPLPDMPDVAAFDAAEAAATMEAASYMDLSLAEQAALGTPDAWPDADLHRRRLEALEAGAAVAAVDAVMDPVEDLAPEDDSWSLTFEPGDLADDHDADPVAEAVESTLAPGMVDDRDDAMLAMAVAAVIADAVVMDDVTLDDAVEATADGPGAVAVDADEAAEHAQPALEAAAEPIKDAEPLADAWVEPEADAVVAEAEPMEPDAPTLEAEAEAEPMDAATDAVEAEAEAEAEATQVAAAMDAVEADVEAEAEAEPIVAAMDAVEAELPVAAMDAVEAIVEAADLEPVVSPEADAHPVASIAAVGVAAAIALPDDDHEADWADLLRHLPAEDEVVPDDWAAMAPALGPDIAPAPLPAAQPPAPPAIQPPPAEPPAAAPAATATPWQLTAPTADAEVRTTAWPPLGPVFRPTPAPAPSPAAPHPSVMAQRTGQQGVLSRGQQAGSPAQLPKGVRPCVSCELPLSASARFCRRCGRPQA